MEKRKLNEIYILTTFLCIFVVLIHLTSAPVTKLSKETLEHMIFFVGNKALSFVVPAFVFLSGLKLTYSYRDKQFFFKEFFIRRFSKILIPYIVWYIIYYVYFRKLGYVEQRDIQMHLFCFFMGKLISPFYFITIIFQFYFLFGFILFLFKKMNSVFLLVLAAIIQFIYFQFVYFQYEDRFFGSYLIYFMLGCFVAFRMKQFRYFLDKHKIEIGLFAFLISIWYLYFAYASNVFETIFHYWRIVGCLFSLSMLLVFYKVSYFLSGKKGLISVCKNIENASYYIFLSHCFVIYYCNEIWYNIGDTEITEQFLLNTIITFPVVFLGCIGYYKLKKRICKRL